VAAARLQLVLTQDMHLNLRFKLDQEDEITALIDQRALRAGNYVEVTDFRHLNFFCAPATPLSEMVPVLCFCGHPVTNS